jgi:putative RNA 2'-phosphotransferase
VEVDLKLEPVEPPDILWHGTTTRFLESILREGLTCQSRQHVHLSGDRETVAKGGVHHGKLVILEIDAMAMAKEGHVFYPSANGVWLTAAVPVSYLKV